MGSIAQAGQAQQAQQTTTTSSTTVPSGSVTITSSPYVSSNTVFTIPTGSYGLGTAAASAGSIVTYSGGTSPSWTTAAYTPYIDPESVISINGSDLKVKDIISRLGELEEIVKSLKFTVELLRP